jgi:hypothetical protein
LIQHTKGIAMDDNTIQDQDPELNDQQAAPEEERRRGWVGWLISGGFHAALIGVMGTVYWMIAVEKEAPPTIISMVTPKEPPKPKQVATVDPTTVPVDLTVPDDDQPDTPVTSMDVQVDNTTNDENDVPDTSPGDPTKLANMEFDSSGVFATIGANANDGSLYSNRPGPGGKRGPGLGHPHGSKPKDDAIMRALKWFKRHQSPNGSWDAARYPVNCSDDPKCEPGDSSVGGDVNVAMTGYAILCFLGDGYDHMTQNKFRTTVKKGLDYLVSVQKADGLLGERNYEHAIAAKAIIEAYGMTGDPALKDPAQKATNVMIARQNQDPNAADKAYGGFGWDYVNPGDRNDSSVTGWNVMALKSALASGLSIGNAMGGAKQWLQKTWEATNANTRSLDPYKDETRFPYTIMGSSGKVDIAPAPAPGAPAADSKDLACVGLMAAVFLGHHSGDPMLETLANYVDHHELPAAYPCNTYKLYYDCLGIYQVGGEKWKRWDERVTGILVNAQRGDGCYDGSWDFNDTKFHGHQAGRVLSTAYCCLSLEACYLYHRVTGQDERPGKKH